MATSKSIEGCDANDLLQYFSLGQEATETSPFLHTLNSFADIMSLVPQNISPCKTSNLTRKHRTTIGVIYRHPKNSIAHFRDELSKTLDSYLNQPRDLALMGNFNINLDPEKRQTEAWHYLKTLLGFGLFPVITKPTRVTVTSQTLIDHIFTNITV